MSRALLYMASPLRPTEEEIAEIPMRRVERGRGEYEPDTWMPVPDAERVKLAAHANLHRAMAWLSWLRRSFPETTFIAPWIASVLAGEDDADPAQREAGLVDACAVIERCDGIVLCGGRISEGMRREMEHGIQNGHRYQGSRIESFKVYDLTSIGAEIPTPAPEGASVAVFDGFRDWAVALGFIR